MKLEDRKRPATASLQAPWELRAGLTEGGIRSIEIGPGCDVMWLEAELTKLWEKEGIGGNGFSNAIGRPKKGPEKALGRARRGPKYVRLDGFSTQPGPLGARGWRGGRSLNVHGSQDWPGLRVDPDVGHGLPTQRKAFNT